MNRSRRRHNRAVATAIAMTAALGICSAGAWAQTGGAPTVGSPSGGGRITTAAPPTGGGPVRPAPGGATPGGTGAPRPGTPNPGGTGAPRPGTPTPSLGNKTPSTPDAAAATLPAIIPAVSAPVRPSANAYTNPQASQKELDAFVAQNLQNLLNDTNPEAQAKARDNLKEATQQSGAPASPTFLLEYGQALNNAFLAKLTPQNKLTVRQRLNIAIVAAKFAYSADNITLQDTTKALLKDPAEPVVLWGLKAAQPQVPQLLKFAGGKVPALVALIVPAVFANPSGPIFEEGYQALSGNDKVVADELMKLWQNRLTQYQTKVPQDPSADGRPAFKLTTAQMWAAVVNNPATQQKVMQMVVDQLSAAAQWADQPGNDDTRAQLVALCRQCVAGLQVVGQHQKQQQLQTAAATALGSLDPKTYNLKTPVKPIVDPVVHEVLNAFKGVLEPPAVGPSTGGGQTGVAQP